MQLNVLVDSPEISIGYNVEKQWLYVDRQGEHDQENTHAACLLLLSSLLARQAVEIPGTSLRPRRWALSTMSSRPTYGCSNSNPPPKW